MKNKLKTYIYFKWLDKKGYAICDGSTEVMTTFDTLYMVLIIFGMILSAKILFFVINYKRKK